MNLTEYLQPLQTQTSAEKCPCQVCSSSDKLPAIRPHFARTSTKKFSRQRSPLSPANQEKIPKKTTDQQPLQTFKIPIITFLALSVLFYESHKIGSWALETLSNLKERLTSLFS